ncbi:MAG: hypothetical protein H6550_16295 [Chitinophagales bacterium]|nr:hypothetical protein [Chitinophagales bacterium]
MKELETSIYSHYNDVPADVISDVLTTVLDAITDKYSAVYYPANFVCTATYVGFVKKELQEII